MVRYILRMSELGWEKFNELLNKIDVIAGPAAPGMLIEIGDAWIEAIHHTKAKDMGQAAQELLRVLLAGLAAAAHAYVEYHTSAPSEIISDVVDRYIDDLYDAPIDDVMTILDKVIEEVGRDGKATAS